MSHSNCICLILVTNSKQQCAAHGDLQMAQVHKHRMRGRASPYGTWSYAKAFRFAVARNHFIEVDLMNTNNSKSRWVR